MEPLSPRDIHVDIGANRTPEDLDDVLRLITAKLPGESAGAAYRSELARVAGLISTGDTVEERTARAVVLLDMFATYTAVCVAAAVGEQHLGVDHSTFMDRIEQAIRDDFFPNGNA